MVINLGRQCVGSVKISLKKSKLGGDKGYIFKNLKNEILNNYNISLITCNKKKKN